MMKRERHFFCFIFLVVVAGCFVSQDSSFAAEAYPQKPIQVIVPFEAGGPTDIGIRVWTDQLRKFLKDQVIVINRGGAGGALGTRLVVDAKNDGYTLLGGSTTPIVVMPITNPKEVTYDSLRDMESIAHCMALVNFMVVRGDSRFNKFEDLEKYVKANPGKLTMGVPGIAHPFFLFHILKEEGLDMNLVVAKGAPQNVSYLQGGHVDVILIQVGMGSEYIREGKWKALAFFANKRLPDFPDIPTIAEKGYPKAAFPFWIGFYAPKGTPQSILDVVAAALREAAKDPEVVDKLNKLGYPIEFKTGREVRALIEEQQKVIREIAVRTKIIN